MLSGFFDLILSSYLITHLINTVVINSARLITELRFCDRHFPRLTSTEETAGPRAGIKYSRVRVICHKCDNQPTANHRTANFLGEVSTGH